MQWPQFHDQLEVSVLEFELTPQHTDPTLLHCQHQQVPIHFKNWRFYFKARKPPLFKKFPICIRQIPS
jgi:hypothetical protein